VTDRLAEIKERWADGTLGYADYAALGAAAAGKADIDWLVGEVERLQRFEAMWRDACRHRDTAEARARHYQDLLRAIEVLVHPEKEEPL
jgi:hypothetical protein